MYFVTYYAYQVTSQVYNLNMALCSWLCNLVAGQCSELLVDVVSYSKNLVAFTLHIGNCLETCMHMLQLNGRESATTSSTVLLRHFGVANRQLHA